MATFRRAHSLGKLLHSVLSIEVPHCNLKMTVADNDPDGPSLPAVKRFAASVPWLVDCVIVPKRGIATVRNQLVERAFGERADYIVFLDDDVVVEPRWLSALYDSALRFQADAVAGPYHMVLENDAPDWFRRSGIAFRQDYPVTGTRIKCANTANLLFKAAALNEFSGPFDERTYGLVRGHLRDTG